MKNIFFLRKKLLWTALLISIINLGPVQSMQRDQIKMTGDPEEDFLVYGTTLLLNNETENIVCNSQLSLIFLEEFDQILKVFPTIFKKDLDLNSINYQDFESLTNAQLMKIPALVEDYKEYVKNGANGTTRQELSYLIQNFWDAFKILSTAKGAKANRLKCFSKKDTYDKNKNLIDFCLLRICNDHPESIEALKRVVEQLNNDPRSSLSKEDLDGISPFRNVYGYFYDEDVVTQVAGIAQESSFVKRSPQDLFVAIDADLFPYTGLEILAYLREMGEMLKGLSPSLADTNPDFLDIQLIRDQIAHCTTVSHVVSNLSEEKKTAFIEAVTGLRGLKAKLEKSLQDRSTIGFSGSQSLSWEEKEAFWTFINGGIKIENHQASSSFSNLAALIPLKKFSRSKEDLISSIKTMDPILNCDLFHKKTIRKKSFQATVRDELILRQQDGQFKFKNESTLRNDIVAIFDLFRTQVGFRSVDTDLLVTFANGLKDKHNKKVTVEDFEKSYNRTLARALGLISHQEADARNVSWPKIISSVLGHHQDSHHPLSDYYSRFIKKIEEIEPQMILDLGLSKAYDWSLEGSGADIFHTIVGIPLDKEYRKQYKRENIESVLSEIKFLYQLCGYNQESSWDNSNLDTLLKGEYPDDILKYHCRSISHKRNLREYWRNNMNLKPMCDHVKNYIKKFNLDKNEKDKFFEGISLLIGSIYEAVYRISDYKELSVNAEHIKEVRNFYAHRTNFWGEGDYQVFSFEGVNKSSKSYVKNPIDIVLDEASIVMINLRFLLEEAYQKI